MTWDAWLSLFLKIGLPTIGFIAVLGGPLVKYFGTKWLDQQFAKRLEKLKHEQQKELEHVRHAIQMMFSRASKIHEKEFEVLPKAWLMLHEAYGAAMNVVVGFRRFPDFNLLTESQLDEFLEASALSPSQRDALRNAQPNDRITYYLEAIEGIGIADALNQHRLLNNYLIENRIFMSGELYDAFNAVTKLLSEGVNAYQSGR